MEVKNVLLNNVSRVITSDYVYWDRSTNQTSIGLMWNFRDDNETQVAAGWYGDSIISSDAIKIDGDLIFSAGYGDGIAVRRINNDGTFTNVYYDNTPANSYAYYHSIALDKIHKKFYVGNYVYDNLTVYDYSVTESIVDEGNITEASHNLPSDEVGSGHTSGLEIAGDFLYILPDDKATSEVFRWNTQTSASANLTSSYANRSTGQSGLLHYDVENDIMHFNYNTNGELVLVYSASFETEAKAYTIRYSESVGSNDCSTKGSIIDKDNPNYVSIWGYTGRYVKLDISEVLTETNVTPTVVQRHSYFYNTMNTNRPPYWLSVNNFVEHPIYKSDLIFITPRADTYPNFGWWDDENMMCVGPKQMITMEKSDSGTYSQLYTYTGNQDMLRFSYSGTIPIYVESEDSTGYWIHSGYAWDGYKFRSWSADTYPNGFELEKSGSITFGTYQLDNTNNIGEIQINNLSGSLYLLTDTTFTSEVSNNNGSSYETYDYSTEPFHSFSSVGNQVKVKLIFTGNGKRGPHITTHNENLNVTMVEQNFEKYSKSSYYRRTTSIRGST